MRTTLRSTLLALAALAIASAHLHAQYVPPPPPKPFPGFLNEKLRASDPYMSAWDIAANVRYRGESKQGAGFTDAGSNWDFSKRPQDDTDNTYHLTRVMPRIGYTAKSYAFLLEGRSSYSIGDERYGAAAPGKGLAERDGPMDLHQAFVFIGNHKEFPVSLKVGRQELAYGDQRLVGHFRWNNNARTFDAIKLRWQNALFGVDLFSGGVVYNDHNNLNAFNPQDLFSGAYFNFPTLATNEIVEAYVYARNVSRGIVTDNWSGVPAPFRFPGAQDLYTGGLRIKSKPLAYGPYDYGVELMYQAGNRTAVFPAATVAAAKAAARLDHKAYAAVLQGGYTWTDSAAQPRLALLYSYGSGDGKSTDTKSGTFQNLFPTNHLFYGYMDLNSIQNMHDIRLAFNLKPTASVSIAIEAHAHYLAKTTDFWYNIAGVPRNAVAANTGTGYTINPTYSKEIGKEIDIVGAFWISRYAQIEIGLSHYFRGKYIKQSLRNVGSRDANYAYLQTTFNF